MLKKILEIQLVDIEGLFLLNYKNLNISENEAMIIMILLRLEKMNMNYITPSIISNYMTLDEKSIDKLIIGLINKNLLAFTANSISSKPLINALLKAQPQQETKKQETKINLVSCFEKEFARTLTPIEIETLKEWKQCQYDDQMILNALKEATLSNVHNMRYIDKILVEWAKYGMKNSGRDTVDHQEKQIDLVMYEWWNE